MADVLELQKDMQTDGPVNVHRLITASNKYMRQRSWNAYQERQRDLSPYKRPAAAASSAEPHDSAPPLAKRQRGY